MIQTTRRSRGPGIRAESPVGKSRRGTAGSHRAWRQHVPQPVRTQADEWPVL